MNTHEWHSRIMVAGLSRGLWMTPDTGIGSGADTAGSRYPGARPRRRGGRRTADDARDRSTGDEIFFPDDRSDW
jgi:hypothetical protein